MYVRETCSLLVMHFTISIISLFLKFVYVIQINRMFKLFNCGYGLRIEALCMWPLFVPFYWCEAQNYFMT
jgi:hypothetical protein